jgi:hypothetical protein
MSRTINAGVATVFVALSTFAGTAIGGPIIGTGSSTLSLTSGPDSDGLDGVTVNLSFSIIEGSIWNNATIAPWLSHTILLYSHWGDPAV